MNPRFSFLAGAAAFALSACSAANNIGIQPPVNTDINLTSSVQTGAAPVQDPPYGTEQGMGGEFKPFTVPGF